MGFNRIFEQLCFWMPKITRSWTNLLLIRILVNRLGHPDASLIRWIFDLHGVCNTTLIHNIKWSKSYAMSFRSRIYKVLIEQRFFLNQNFGFSLGNFESRLNSFRSIVFLKNQGNVWINQSGIKTFPMNVKNNQPGPKTFQDCLQYRYYTPCLTLDQDVTNASLSVITRSAEKKDIPITANQNKWTTYVFWYCALFCFIFFCY